MAYEAPKFLQFDTPMRKAVAVIMVPVVVGVTHLPAHCGGLLEKLTFYGCPPEHQHQPHTDKEEATSTSSSTVGYVIGTKIFTS